VRLSNINKSWTLFLDRDGVIKKKIENDYVKNIGEFEFLPNALHAIVECSKVFGKIIVVTNQQGIGKGLMTESNLNSIHQHLLDKVQQAGGRIDAIYHAPKLAQENSEMRKPNIGMALKAKKQFPEIEFQKSIMVGDSMSDIEFGKKAKMHTFLIGENQIYTSLFQLFQS
jgi:D-glycero-D-manno-heptose 1,7-bisphosphate phosphatase